MSRHLDWEGCFNVRDLGGLATGDGRETRRGAVARADALDRLTARGWTALVEHGVRTVVDLRNDSEIGSDTAARPGVVTTIHLPLDGVEDREFWSEWDSGPQFGTPLYYGPHLSRFPERSAAVIAAIANAGPGGVVFHCGGGRDRAGQIAMLVLALAGVRPADIAADYGLSRERLGVLYATRGEDDQAELLDGYLAGLDTTAEDVIAGLLESVDVEACLRDGGLTAGELAALRARLVVPTPS